MINRSLLYFSKIERDADRFQWKLFCNQSNFWKNMYYWSFFVYNKNDYKNPSFVVSSLSVKKIQGELWTNKQPSLRWHVPCAIQNGNKLCHSNSVILMAQIHLVKITLNLAIVPAFTIFFCNPIFSEIVSPREIFKISKLFFYFIWLYLIIIYFFNFLFQAINVPLHILNFFFKNLLCKFYAFLIHSLNTFNIFYCYFKVTTN